MAASLWAPAGRATAVRAIVSARQTVPPRSLRHVSALRLLSPGADRDGRLPIRDPPGRAPVLRIIAPPQEDPDAVDAPAAGVRPMRRRLQRVGGCGGPRGAAPRDRGPRGRSPRSR